MILYIASPETDYGQDIFYSGLVQKFGRQRVMEWPFKLAYYCSRKVYPRNLGDCGWQGLLSRSQNSFSLLAMKQEFWRNVEVVILGACKAKCFQKYLEIADRIPAKTPVVFNDGGDFSELGGHLKASDDFHLFERAVHLRPFSLILKREYLDTIHWGPEVIPFPFGFNFSVLSAKLLEPEKTTEKKYKVSFWAVESHPIRTQVLQQIQNDWDCRENGTQVNQTFHKYKRKGLYYLEELRRCQVVLNFRGVGWDTLRYWEVPAIGGCMVTEIPRIRIPNNFVNEEHLLFCKEDLTDLSEKCEWVLQNADRALAMGARARQHALQFHSAPARAEQFQIALENVTGVRL